MQQDIIINQTLKKEKKNIFILNIAANVLNVVDVFIVTVSKWIMHFLIRLLNNIKCLNYYNGVNFYIQDIFTNIDNLTEIDNHFNTHNKINIIVV